ncbi:MAG: hypothetical protein JJU37_14730 [Balneolaceae bacterium]|nr:hypothetical protein [Balneolaceae bacterium]
MPTVTRWFIKAGLIYFLMGVILAFTAELPFINSGALLLPVYWHMLVMGWLTQIIIGVSIWMFPRKWRDKKKRESVLTWLTFWLLNSGLILRFFTEPFLPFFNDTLTVQLIIITSAILQIAAICTYIAEIWPRVHSKKRKRGVSA